MVIISKKKCLRFATQQSEGQGWSFYKNDDWVLPMAEGVVNFEDDLGVPRMVVIDPRDETAWELSTSDRITYVKPPELDKDSSEISGEKWGPELVLSPDSEHLFLTHQLSHAFIGPEFPDMRGQDGYDNSGIRDDQELSLETYADGEKITPLSVSQFPENGDITFPGVRGRSRKYQMVFQWTAGEMVITGFKHEYIGEIKLGSRAERKMSQHDYTQEFSRNKALHLARAYYKPLYDRVSKDTLTGTYTTITGPDSFSNSAYLLSADLEVENAAIVGDYTICLWAKSLTPIAGVVFTRLDVSGDWNFLYATGAGLAADLIVSSGESFFDLRISEAEISVAALGDYYNNVVRDQGKAYIPL